MNFKLSEYIHILENEEILGLNSILYSTRTGISIELPNNILKEILAINFKNIPNEILKKIIQMEVYVPSEEIEMQEILNANKLGVYDSDQQMLSHVIQPSGNCQLGCHYCGQLHTNKVMSQEVLDLTFQRITDKCNEMKDTIKALEITWYVGSL